MSTDGYGKVDLKPSLMGQKLTEREWRSPLTWLDRFRDAVLLPASWGDENIQHRGGKKYRAKVTLQIFNISPLKHMLKLSDARWGNIIFHTHKLKTQCNQVLLREERRF